ncbi:ankyrin repeat-containing domain protein [Mycena pura]|uniref:Ankyrin repeat-containing domain protein n=1 Tax=Mycena pura TaxID=153505 RepID=A0AAD6Y7I7_9AGAR|nr:ankyrin repeat-containing domain protein [Mycena pura]
MADIVGLLASILQLVDTVAKARHYIHDFRDAPKEQERLLDEIGTLEPLIRKFDNLMIGASPAAGTEMVRNFEEPLNQLKIVMEQLAQKLDLDGIRKLSGRVTWSMWGKDDVQQALNTVERYKSLLNTWLGLDIWFVKDSLAVSRADLLQEYISSSIADVADGQRADHGHIIRSLKRTVNALEDATDDQRIDQNYISRSVRNVARNQERHLNAVKRDEIIRWFSPLNFFPRQADIFNACQPDTGGWLLQEASFKKWKSGSTETVWCRGMPGAGKTVLCAIVVDYLRRNLDSENIRIAVVYLNHKETEAQSPSNVLAAIWQQLILEKPLSHTIEQLYAKHHEQRTRPSLDDTYAALCSTASQLSRVFIAVDALDEYPEEQRHTLLQHLSTLGPCVSLMVISRPHINIKHTISNFETIEIRAAKDDIQKYLDGQIEKSQRLSRHVRSAPDVRQALESRIVEGSDGMFLLAKLHIHSLTTKHTVKALREALNNMPEDLDSTYDEVVARINQQSRDDKELAWLSLSWITHAKRPLLRSELMEALAVEPGSAELDPENLLDTDSILSVCAGLVVIHEEDDTIRLVHYTMQNYLEQRQTKEFPHASTNITMTCMTYLSFDIFGKKVYRDNPQTLFSAHPFLNYAVEYCLIHARGDPEERIQENIVSFLRNCSIWRELWNRTNFPTVSEARLWIAAAFGLEIICQSLIKEDGLGRVLQEASLKGRIDMVQVLLKSRTPAARIPLEYGHALAAAAGRGHFEIIRLLVYAGAEVNTKGKDHGTALCAASFRGDYEIVGLLLKHRADINANGPKGTALQAACSAGHEAVARFLLDSGADIRTAGERALLAASLKGDAAIVRLLLEYGIDPYTIRENLLQMMLSAGHKSVARVLIEHGVSQSSRYELNAKVWHASALQAASRNGQDTIVKMLINLDPYLDSTSYNNALDAALVEWQLGVMERFNVPEISLAVSPEGYEVVIRLLLQHGAVMRDTSAYNTALLVRDEGFMQLLFEHGASAFAGSTEYGHILQKASCMGAADILRLLLKHGASDNPEWHRTNALQVAAAAGNEEFVAEILIEHGADVNAVGSESGNSALHAAVMKGHMAIIEILLEHGADVVRDGSALQAASAMGHREIVEILIAHGANVNAIARREPSWGSHRALAAASAGGHKEIVEILIAHGADVNAVSGLSDSALKAASAGGHKEIVEILIAHGADDIASGQQYCNALQAASARGHKEIVEIFIAHGADVNCTASSFGRGAQRNCRNSHRTWSRCQCDSEWATWYGVGGSS